MRAADRAVTSARARATGPHPFPVTTRASRAYPRASSIGNHSDAQRAITVYTVVATAAVLAAFLVHTRIAYAQGPASGTNAGPGGSSALDALPPDSLVYYDADDVSFSRETGEVIAKGDVFFLVGEVYIRAEKITYNGKAGLVVAEGDVRVLRNKERIRAARIVLDRNTREARMDDVQIIADPSLEDARLSREVLGFTVAELAFEAERSEREKEMEAELRRLRERYVALRNLARVKRDGTESGLEEQAKAVRRYGQILERLSRTRFQPNAVLQNLPPEERDRTLRRREAARQYALQNKEAVERAVGLRNVPGYVRLRAARLYQTPQGIYKVEDASVTPCRCDDDGIPLWGLSTRAADVEPEEYVTLRGATVDVATVPVGYTPWLRFPIKTKRQTGLLLPSFYASRSGEVFAQPLFVTLGDHADTTFTVNQFSRRGRRYDLELRAQLSPESRVRLYGEYIKDELYPKEFRENAKRLDEAAEEERKTAPAGKLTPARQEELRANLGRDRTYRYYTQNSLNLPLSAWGAAKGDVEAVSDNRYLTDFGKEVGSTQDLFSPSQTSKRFLTQEAATEYYGNDVTLSARVQGTRDTFARGASETPARLPRVEFHLLPKRYFDGPIAVEGSGTWERVHRLGGTAFVDVDPGTVTAPTAPGQPDTTLSPGRNGLRDPNEPFVEGDRSHLEGRLTLPLPANDYVNAYAAARGVATQYRFPYTLGWERQRPWQTYNAYEARLEVPMYGTTTLRDEKNGVPYATVREDFLPAVTFTYIPSVERSETFPKTYELFYAEDDVTTKQELGLSFTTSWTVGRLAFAPTGRELPRLPPKRETGVANETLFQEVLEERRVSIENSPEQIFGLSAASASHEIFIDWATLELSRYEDSVLRSEFGKPFVWPETGSFARGNAWEMKPLSLSIATTYNFQAEKTAAEKNARLGPGDAEVPVERWGDVTGTVGWSLYPFVPLSGAVAGTWRRPWDRFKTFSTSVSTTLPYGLAASFSNGYEVAEEVDELKGTKSYPLTRTIGTDVSWQPLTWLKTQYQRKVEVKPRRAVSGEDEYSALQKISFLQLQDCLDITLQRFKDLGVQERYAVWSLGVNLRFLGQERAFDNAGAAVNNRIQDRAKRNDPSR